MEVPEEPAGHSLLDFLIKERVDDEVVGLRIQRYLGTSNPASWDEFLTRANIREFNALEKATRSSVCQFTSVADQLFLSKQTSIDRPASFLRSVAIQVIKDNPTYYQDFLLYHDSGTTSRSKRKRDNRAISIAEYTRSVSHGRFDGDLITLQALCDAFKFRVKLVRWALDGEDRTASGCSVAQRHAWTDIHVRVDDGAGHANSVAVKGEHSDDANSSRNVFIADILRPRDVLNIKELVCSMQVPRRSLWLAQSGEVYFSSMVIRDPVTDEERAMLSTIPPEDRLGDEAQKKGGQEMELPDVENCPICMSPVTGNEDEASLDSCEHIFHFDCITKWGETTNSCPMCKGRFHEVTCIAVKRVRRFEGEIQPAPDVESDEGDLQLEAAVCMYCGDGGDADRLMLCDSEACPNGAHTYCSNLEEVPVGDWFCAACRGEQADLMSSHPPVSTRPERAGLGGSTRSRRQSSTANMGISTMTNDALSATPRVAAVAAGNAARPRRCSTRAETPASSEYDLDVLLEIEDFDEDDEDDEDYEDYEADQDTGRDGHDVEVADGADRDLRSHRPSSKQPPRSSVSGPVLRRTRGNSSGGELDTSTAAEAASRNTAETPHQASVSNHTPSESQRAVPDGELATLPAPAMAAVTAVTSERQEKSFTLPAIGVTGPNLWPRVLASASAALAPQHSFEAVDVPPSSQDDVEGSSGDEDTPSRRPGVGIVEQSWADASLATQKLETRSKRAGAKEKRKAADTQKKSSLHRAVSATTGGNLRSPIGGCGTGSNATSQATSSSSSISAANDTRRLPAASRSYERPQPVTAALPSGSSVSQSGSGTPMLPRRRREDGAMEGMQQTRSTVPDVRMRQPEIRAFVRKLRLAGLSERQRRGSSSSAVALHSEPEAHDSSPRSLSKNPLTVYGDVEVLFEELRKITRHGDRNTMDTLLSSEILQVLHLWLEPSASGRAFLPSGHRTTLLKVLLALPVQKVHLRRSGMGKLAVAMARDHAESGENRMLLRQLLRRWSNLVLITSRDKPGSVASSNDHPSPHVASVQSDQPGNTSRTPRAFAPRMSSATTPATATASTSDANAREWPTGAAVRFITRERADAARTMSTSSRIPKERHRDACLAPSSFSLLPEETGSIGSIPRRLARSVDGHGASGKMRSISKRGSGFEGSSRPTAAPGDGGHAELHRRSSVCRTPSTLRRVDSTEIPKISSRPSHAVAASGGLASSYPGESSRSLSYGAGCPSAHAPPAVTASKRIAHSCSPASNLNGKRQLLCRSPSASLVGRAVSPAVAATPRSVDTPWNRSYGSEANSWSGIPPLGGRPPEKSSGRSSYEIPLRLGRQVQGGGGGASSLPTVGTNNKSSGSSPRLPAIRIDAASGPRHPNDGKRKRP